MQVHILEYVQYIVGIAAVYNIVKVLVAKEYQIQPSDLKILMARP